MRAQLKAAGIETGDDAIARAVAASVDQCQGDFEAAVRLFYAELDAPAWFFVLFDIGARTNAARKLLASAFQARREAGASRGVSPTAPSPPHQSPLTGQTTRDTQKPPASDEVTPSAPPGQLNSATHRPGAGRAQTPSGEHPESGAGQAKSVTHVAGARPANPPRAASAIAAVSAVARRTVLDTHMTALGKPLGDCTRIELRALSRRSRRDAWFYDAIAHPMPEGDGAVRVYWSPEDVERTWHTADRANSIEVQA